MVADVGRPRGQAPAARQAAPVGASQAMHAFQRIRVRHQGLTASWSHRAAMVGVPQHRSTRPELSSTANSRQGSSLKILTRTPRWPSLPRSLVTSASDRMLMKLLMRERLRWCVAAPTAASPWQRARAQRQARSGSASSRAPRIGVATRSAAHCARAHMPMPDAVWRRASQHVPTQVGAYVRTASTCWRRLLAVPCMHADGEGIGARPYTSLPCDHCSPPRKAATPCAHVPAHLP